MAAAGSICRRGKASGRTGESLPGSQPGFGLARKRRQIIATEFTVRLEHHPGSLAFLSKALGEAEVNIRSLAGMVCNGKGVIKLITSDVEATRAKLEEVHADFDQREILTVTMADRPGALGDFARVLWEANVNIDTIYVLDTAGGYTELAIGVDKLEEAKQLPLAQY